MPNDPHDELNRLDEWIARQPPKPTIHPHKLEDHDQHWEDPHHWRISGWLFFWAFIGGVVWSLVFYSAYLIYWSV